MSLARALRPSRLPARAPLPSLPPGLRSTAPGLGESAATLPVAQLEADAPGGTAFFSPLKSPEGKERGLCKGCWGGAPAPGGAARGCRGQISSVRG